MTKSFKTVLAEAIEHEDSAEYEKTPDPVASVDSRRREISATLKALGRSVKQVPKSERKSFKETIKLIQQALKFVSRGNVRSWALENLHNDMTDILQGLSEETRKVFMDYVEKITSIMGENGSKTPISYGDYYASKERDKNEQWRYRDPYYSPSRSTTGPNTERW